MRKEWFYQNHPPAQSIFQCEELHGSDKGMIIIQDGIQGWFDADNGINSGLILQNSEFIEIDNYFENRWMRRN